MKKVLAMLVALMILAAIAGCSDSKDSGSTNPPAKQSNLTAKLIEPDALISRQEAEQYIGQPLKNAEKKDQKAVGMKLAIYNTTKEATGKFLQVSITQQSYMPPHGQSPKSIYDSIKGNFSEAAMVEGIGDEAFFAPPGLHILYKGYYIVIAVGNSSDEQNRALLKSIGEKALENLDKMIKP